MTRLQDIKKDLLKSRGTTFKPGSREPARPDELDTWFDKTPLMLYIEAKMGRPIEQILNSGSINGVWRKIKKAGIKLDRSTIVKWRNRLEYRREEIEDEKFWSNFK